MGKKYVSKRLQKRNLDFHDFLNTRLIDKTAETSVERLITTTEKKLRISRARLRANSTSTTQSTIEEDDEPVVVDIDESDPQDTAYNNINIIVNIDMILNLVNIFCCPSCKRVGKMSQKVVQRRGLLYRIMFLCSCSFETSFTNSTPLVHSSTSRMDELNMMACAAANIVGIKRTGMTTVLGMLNSLPPVQIESWNKYQKIYSTSLEIVKDESLGRAGKHHYFLIL